jgi:hypothetical protein
MDSLTHIYFAEKLLRSTGLDPAAGICSLFPQIDREPAYFHRMYAHPFFQIKRLAAVGHEVYKTGQIRHGEERGYAWLRFHADRPRMRSFAAEYARRCSVNVPEYDPDNMSVLLAYVSHVYQDIFNNPMQAFLPKFVYPCGSWELWGTLDAIDFRTVLYAPSNIDDFRAEFFDGPLWGTRLSAPALLEALVRKTAEASAIRVPPPIVTDAVASLGIQDGYGDSDLVTALEFLTEHEQSLKMAIRKYACAQRRTGQMVPVRS